jgi:hypothetical protein
VSPPVEPVSEELEEEPESVELVSVEAEEEPVSVELEEEPVLVELELEEESVLVEPVAPVASAAVESWPLLDGESPELVLVSLDSELPAFVGGASLQAAVRSRPTAASAAWRIVEGTEGLALTIAAYACSRWCP